MAGRAERSVSEPTFEEVFVRFRGAVRLQVQRIVQDYHEAEDLTQETFLRAFLRWRERAAVGNPCRWLLGIARHTALDGLRERRRRARLAGLPRVPVRPAPGRDSEHCLPALVEGVLRLPRNLALTLLLYGLDRLSIREISRLTGTTPGNVKVRLHRARRLLARRSRWTAH